MLGVPEYLIPFKLLAGDANIKKRIALWRIEGVKQDIKRQCWVVPSEDVLRQFAPTLTVGFPPPPPPSVQASPMPPPKPVAPPPPAPPPPPASPVVVKPPAQAAPVLPVEPSKRVRVMELPPCILVLQTVSSPLGGIKRRTLDVQTEVILDEETKRVLKKKERKTMERVVSEPEEHRLATALSNRLRNVMHGLGRWIQRGVILVPIEQEDEVYRLEQEQERELAEFNAKARFYYLSGGITVANIKGDGEKEARRLAFQLQIVADSVSRALASADREAITKAVEKAEGLSKVVPKIEGDTLLAAINQATDVAKWLKVELEDKGRTIYTVKRELAERDLSAVNKARMAFAELAVPVEIAVRQQVAGRFASLNQGMLEPIVTPAPIPSGRFAQ